MSLETEWLKTLAIGSISIAFAFLSVAAIVGCSGSEDRQVAVNRETNLGQQQTSTGGGEKMKLEVPSSIAAEHRELHEELEKAIGSGGKTGEAAKVVGQRLGVHFEKEEEYALPELGLLVPLASGNVSPDMRKAVEMADKLKADLPNMLAEHKSIVEALNTLEAAAKEENKRQAESFVEKLKAHAQTEEQVMYPAAIMVGEYLKLKLK